MGRKYKSVNQMVNNLTGWKFKISWYWLKIVKWLEVNIDRIKNSSLKRKEVATADDNHTKRIRND